MAVQFEPCKAKEECYTQEQKSEVEERVTAKNSQGDKRAGRAGKVLTRSLVERRVDGNLKVSAVEVGRLVQHGQHILNQGRETDIYFNSFRPDATNACIYLQDRADVCALLPFEQMR